MNLLLCIILGFCLTFSTWLEPSKLFAQECTGCDDTVWTYAYDPGDFLLTVPWSSTTSRNAVLVFLTIGLGAIAGMIAGNVASKNNNKHHHHHKDNSHGTHASHNSQNHHKHKHKHTHQRHKSVNSPGIGFSF